MALDLRNGRRANQDPQRGPNGRFTVGGTGGTGGPGRPPGRKNRTSLDMRTLRRRMLSVFDEIGGEEKLAEWAAENYPDFLLRVVIPLLPKHIDEDGVTERDLVFDREKFNRYLEQTGKSTPGD